MEVIRPLLACTIDNLELLRFPVIASAKLDGIRCVIDNGVAISRNGKPIRNKYIQQIIGGLDGELIVGPPNGDGVFNRTTSGVMSADGEPDFTFWIFDDYNMAMTSFERRVLSLQDRKLEATPRLTLLPQVTINSLSELNAFEKQILEAGYEGVMLRRPDGPYKQGRSTLNEQILLRLKRFRDGEAIVIDIEEGKINDNEIAMSPLGYAKRSTHQANMRRANRVGTLICSDIATGERLRVSPGRMTAEQRNRYWVFPALIIDKQIKYKCFDYGAIDTPRFPTFQGFLGVTP
jgi:DNA ligase-1